MDDDDGSSVTGDLRASDGLGVVRLEAHLAADLDTVWSALTDPRRLEQWLGDLAGDLRLGGEVRARFSATGWEGTLRPEVCDHADRLVIRTSSEGEPDCVIAVTLAADGGRTTAVFEDRGLPLAQLAAYGAGDQVLVEDLAAHLAGRSAGDARARWQELHPRYRALAAELLPKTPDGP